MSISETAMAFFDACETGKGWNVCKTYCQDGATFTCEADALADISTIEDYTAWTAGILTPIPDGNYDITSFSTDHERNIVTATAVFSGKQTGEGGPVPATGKEIATNYAYVMEFEGDKIARMTKIWNDGHSLKQLGWA
ncbi:ester cyclase [Ruegeria faecimaris]|uniref:SnoaL-like polyketide cyclase n=1 Tax=Ruegeria faecimaris TaxID=686389 RepID=A0A521FIJ5_9RHOB|nr:ester cyclase [Ruegeria faecimaris]SMO95988.1 SnoaL-like polyketide cyclase [Ruegeria faecimaris]